MKVRFDYVRGGDHRQRNPVALQRCASRFCSNMFRPTRKGHRYCTKSCGDHAHRGPVAPRQCIGYPNHACHKMLRHKSRCGACQKIYRNIIAPHADDELKPTGPKVCGLNGCSEILLFQVNRAGQTVTYCNRHGERLMSVYRPGEQNYPKPPEVRYQRPNGRAA